MFIFTSLQVFHSEKGSLKLFADRRFGLKLFRPIEFKVHGRRFNQEQEEAARWLLANAQNDEVIGADGVLFEPIEFFLKGKYQVDCCINYVNYYPKNEPDTVPLGTPVYVMSYRKFKRSLDGRFVVFLYEEDFIEKITADHVDYVVLGGLNQFISRYFMEVSWASKVFSYEDTDIFKINHKRLKEATESPTGTREKPDKLESRIFINDDFAKDMSWLSENYPEELSNLNNVFERLGIQMDTLGEQGKII